MASNEQKRTRSFGDMMEQLWQWRMENINLVPNWGDHILGWLFAAFFVVMPLLLGLALSLWMLEGAKKAGAFEPIFKNEKQQIWHDSEGSWPSKTWRGD